MTRPIDSFGLFRVNHDDAVVRQDGHVNTPEMYHVYGPHPWRDGKPMGDRLIVGIPMQTGLVREVGANGATEEVLLAIVADRLERLAAGPLVDSNTRDAAAFAREAMECLRTKDREERGNVIEE